VTSAAWIALGFAALAAVLDWVAVARRSLLLEYLGKPATTVALFVLAASLDVAHDGSWGLLLAALVACLLGDVFLMLPRDAFIPGLGSFAVAQAIFAAGFVVGGVDAARLVVGVIVAVPVVVVLARRFVGALRRAGRAGLVAPVVVYMVVISAMAVTAVGAGSPLAIAGAVLFMASDALIAESRFVRERAWQPVTIMVTYHLALTGLVLGHL
jgi:uncharacterized membrane protein YhhN